MPYIYHNENPQNYHVPDCVIRAIKLAMQIPYDKVVELLSKNGKIYQCDCLNKVCYEKLLDYDFNLPHYICCDKTVEELASDFSDNVLIIRIEGHLTTSCYGNIYDIWDCSDELVTDFWIVE